jgi:transcriptional regulator with XRE-family HTH domain
MKNKSRTLTKQITRVKFSYPTYQIGEDDHDPVIDHLHTLIDDAGVNLKDVSEKSHVTRSTLKSWFNNKTRSPRHMTLAAVASSLGYEYKLVKK